MNPIRQNIPIHWKGNEIGISVQCRKSGPQWLLALHGLQSNQNIFSDLMSDPQFSEFSILTLDLLGFGDSDKPKDFSYDFLEQAEIISLVLEKKRIQRLSIIGHQLSSVIREGKKLVKSGAVAESEFKEKGPESEWHTSEDEPTSPI